MTDPGMYERFSLEHFPECLKEYADLLTWYQYWHTTLDISDAPCLLGMLLLLVKCATSFVIRS
jgi:hypothetical protein